MLIGLLWEKSLFTDHKVALNALQLQLMMCGQKEAQPWYWSDTELLLPVLTHHHKQTAATLIENFHILRSGAYLFAFLQNYLSHVRTVKRISWLS